jgi:hypothetical protein
VDKRQKTEVGLVILVVVFAASLTSLLVTKLTFDGDISSSDIKPVTSQYIKLYGAETRIFLISAIPSYGEYPFESARVYPGSGSPEIHKGDQCLIINVTVRSDYSSDYPLPSSMSVGFPNSTKAEVSLDALLYDGDNRTINTTNVTPPLPRVPAEINAPIFSLESGETLSFEMYFTIAKRNVEAFTIVSLYVGAMPPP